jgi:pimeloyl-ACP methyl ester carboxylesterase
MTHYVTSNDGTTIAFAKYGSGPAVVLIDGALCSRVNGPLGSLAALLAPHFTVFLYDRRGRNESGDTKPYAVERELEDLNAVIKEAGGSVFLFGMSSGAILAIMAAGRGIGIKKLALYEPPVLAGSTNSRGLVDHRANLEEFIVAGNPGGAAKYFLTKMVGMPPILMAILRILPVWAKLKAVAHTLPYDAEITKSNSLPDQLLASVSTPTIAVFGEKSPDFLRQAASGIAKALPNAKEFALKGQTHNVSTKILAPVITDFFKSQ